MNRIGILTGGGDCPGLNAVIRAVVRKCANAGREVVGILDGWKGMIHGDYIQLTIKNTDGILHEGGTILGTSRTNPYKKPADVNRVVKTFKRLKLSCLIAVGGDDTLGVAARLYREKRLPTVGVPKTIDNDLSSTDITFGFDTAVNVAAEAIDRVRTTARSHHRVMVVETMGRHAGWIAAYAGMAGGADYILVPEKPVDIDAVCRALKEGRQKTGRRYNIVVVSEGVTLRAQTHVARDTDVDAFGHVRLGGIGEWLANAIQQRTGFEARAVILGHLQRGGSPSGFDRVLATRYGVKAAKLALFGNYGKMVRLHGTKIAVTSLSKATGTTRYLDLSFFQTAEEFWK